MNNDHDERTKAFGDHTNRTGNVQMFLQHRFAMDPTPQNRPPHFARCDTDNGNFRGITNQFNVRIPQFIRPPQPVNRTDCRSQTFSQNPPFINMPMGATQRVNLPPVYDPKVPPLIHENRMSVLNTRPPAFMSQNLPPFPPPVNQTIPRFPLPANQVVTGFPPPLNRQNALQNSGQIFPFDSNCGSSLDAMPDVSVPPPPIVFHSGAPSLDLNVKPNTEYGVQNTDCDPKEMALLSFLSQFQKKDRSSRKHNLTVAQFRAALQKGLSLFKQSLLCKENLSHLLHSDETEWQVNVKQISLLKMQLREICDFVTSPSHLCIVKKKLQTIKKKRQMKKRLKKETMIRKVEEEQEREVLHQEIDKWLDGINEKNEKIKRENEMKKEADNILSEVRKKIHDAKKTMEKLKMFEKLRNIREENAFKKGMIVTSRHAEHFQMKLTSLKEMMQVQLHNYEAEERALKVMLEAEQEDQFEEETRWRKKKLSALQEKRKKNIKEFLFSDSSVPSMGDPLYFFYQHHNSAETSISNLVQIRNQWDVHISDCGEHIPEQWIAPVPPNHFSWESALNS